MSDISFPDTSCPEMDRFVQEYKAKGEEISMGQLEAELAHSWRNDISSGRTQGGYQPSHPQAIPSLTTQTEDVKNEPPNPGTGTSIQEFDTKPATALTFCHPPTEGQEVEKSSSNIKTEKDWRVSCTYDPGEDTVAPIRDLGEAESSILRYTTAEDFLTKSITNFETYAKELSRLESCVRGYANDNENLKGSVLADVIRALQSISTVCVEAHKRRFGFREGYWDVLTKDQYTVIRLHTGYVRSWMEGKGYWSNNLLDSLKCYSEEVKTRWEQLAKGAL